MTKVDKKSLWIFTFLFLMCIYMSGYNVSLDYGFQSNDMVYKYSYHKQVTRTWFIAGWDGVTDHVFIDLFNPYDIYQHSITPIKYDYNVSFTIGAHGNDNTSITALLSLMYEDSEGIHGIDGIDLSGPRGDWEYNVSFAGDLNVEDMNRTLTLSLYYSISSDDPDWVFMVVVGTIDVTLYYKFTFVYVLTNAILIAVLVVVIVPILGRVTRFIKNKVKGEVK